MKTGLPETMYSWLRAGVNAVALAVLLAAALPAEAAAAGFGPGGGFPALRCDPVLTRLFTPAHPQWGQYVACTSAGPMDALVPSGWRIERVEALDAFGATGLFNRSQLLRLYGGRRARVARGWTRSGNTFEAYTLVSPYPDSSLSSLIDGTLVIRWSATPGS